MKIAFKSLLVLTLALILATPPLRADLRLRLGLVGGYHPISNAAFKTIYGSGGFMPGVVAALQFSRLLEARAELDFFSAGGTMTTSEENLSFSLKPQFVALRLTPIKLGLLRPFFGVGLGKTLIREVYPDRIGDYSSSASLSLIEAGLSIKVMNHVDLAAEVRWMRSKARSSVWDQDIDFGGLRPCLEISYIF